jgi:hypothetical protein
MHKNVLLFFSTTIEERSVLFSCALASSRTVLSSLQQVRLVYAGRSALKNLPSVRARAVQLKFLGSSFCCLLGHLI